MSDEQETWKWRFLAFRTAAGNCPVQEWFDYLPDDAKDEARDALVYLQNRPNWEWAGTGYFRPLEHGLSEIRFSTAAHTYRIYGEFGPSGLKQGYTFLHGTDKKVKNDRDGKNLAKKRRGQLERGEAGLHEFDFEDKPDPSDKKGPGSAGTVC